MQLVYLLLQIMALELPVVGILLAFLLAGLVCIQLFLQIFQLFLTLAALGFRHIGTLGSRVRLRLDSFHAGIGIRTLAAQRFQFRLDPTQLLLVFHFMLLGFVGQSVHIRQHIVFIKSEQTGTEPLFLNVLSFRWHGVLHPLAAKWLKIRSACSEC